VPDAPRARARQKDNDQTDRYFTVEDFRETKKIGKREEGLPALELLSDVELNKPTEEEINNNARIIKNTLLEFDVEVEVIDVNVGPTVTQYAVSPYTEQVNEEGETVLNRVRVSQIATLSNDLALALSAKRLRIQAPVPGHSYVGVEVPNRQPSTVALRPVLESEAFYRSRKRPLVLPLGRDVSGEPFIADLGSMPHLLIAGTTGSGKSIMLAAMTTSIVMNNPPDRVRLVLLDPKMVELSRFNGLPHLLGPVETELDRIIEVLRWATREMDLRYKLLEKEAARNIEVYNSSLGRRRQAERLPYIVLIIDEIGDLMMQRPDETERALTRLAQMARAVGIHLMVATQRPSVDVITGLIKANFPARISFAVASGVDSRVILDSTGAESLMGRGDMLFLAPDASGPQRVQGCYISDEEVNAVVAYWREWHDEEIAAGRMEPAGVAPWERGLTRREVLSETDPMLEDAIALVIAEGEASASLIQRRLGLGYPRAARLMDLMQELGVVGAARPGGRTREVLLRPGQDPFKKLVEKRMKNK
jgi:S-DNA-T family DNA segregation ATPase FtsK/SpoIIIE